MVYQVGHYLRMKSDLEMLVAYFTRSYYLLKSCLCGVTF